jgi:threonine/homoserine/homoserine lactone efflux protein
MRPEQALAFFVFSAVAAITPGPSNAMLTATGANAGVLRGLPALLGVSAGMGLMMFLVAFGLGSVILDHPIVLVAVKWCGAAFLCWLAWKIATAGRPGASADGKPIGFVGAAAFQWINPKSWLVCASAAGAYLHAQAGGALAQAMIFGALFILASLPCCFVWLAFGATAQRFLRTERARRTFNIVMGVLLAASVALVLA